MNAPHSPEPQQRIEPDTVNPIFYEVFGDLEMDRISDRLLNEAKEIHKAYLQQKGLSKLLKDLEEIKERL